MAEDSTISPELIERFEKMTGWKWDDLKKQGVVPVDLRVALTPEEFAVLALLAQTPPKQPNDSGFYYFQGNESPFNNEGVYLRMDDEGADTAGIGQEVFSRVADTVADEETDETVENIRLAQEWIKAMRGW